MLSNNFVLSFLSTYNSTYHESRNTQCLPFNRHAGFTLGAFNRTFLGISLQPGKKIKCKRSKENKIKYFQEKIRQNIHYFILQYKTTIIIMNKNEQRLVFHFSKDHLFLQQQLFRSLGYIKGEVTVLWQESGLRIWFWRREEKWGTTEQIE